MDEASRLTSECSLCANALESADHPLAKLNVPIKSSLDFVAIPSAGALVEGWVLVVPRRHTTGLAMLTPPELRRWAEFSGQMRRCIEVAYGPAVLFEHGTTVPRAAQPCSTEHAHAHIVPLAHFSLRHAIDRWLGTEVAWRDVASLQQARNAILGQETYLFLDEPPLRAFTPHPGGSQLVRRVIADLVGERDSWKWQDHPRPEVAIQTATTLHEVIDTLEKNA